MKFGVNSLLFSGTFDQADLGLVEHVNKMGFDAFEVERADAERAWAESEGEIGVAYQPAADRRPAVMALRRTRGKSSISS